MIKFKGLVKVLGFFREKKINEKLQKNYEIFHFKIKKNGFF